MEAHLESTEAYYKHYRHLLKRVRKDLEALRAIGSDYAIFPSAQYAAKVIKRASKDIDKI